MTKEKKRNEIIRVTNGITGASTLKVKVNLIFCNVNCSKSSPERYLSLELFVIDAFDYISLISLKQKNQEKILLKCSCA